MKKLVSTLIAVVILLTAAFNSFAAISFEGTYLFEYDKTVYLFGKLAGDDRMEDAGITVGGKDYPLNKIQEDGKVDKSKVTPLNRTKAFGIGLKDENSKLGLEFDATPYVVVSGNKITAEAVHINRELLKNVTSFTVGGKTVSGFYYGVEDPDFFYGMDTLPENASELPAVVASINDKKLDTKTIAEPGGFVTVVSHKWADGKTDVVANVHFRKISEVTRKITPTSTYAAFSNYYDTSMSGAITGPFWNRYVANKSDTWYDVNSNMAAFMVYDVETIENYAPVAYTLDKIKTGNMSLSSPETFSVYDYVGIIDEQAKHPFDKFPGLDMTSAGKVETRDYAINTVYNGFNSTTIHEGKKAIAFTSDKPGTADNPNYFQYSYIPNEADYELTVKYVAKYPEMTDASLKSISIDGVPIEGFSSDKTDYFIPVTGDVGTHIITAVPTIEGATVAIDDNEIIVTAKDGVTTKKYTVNFRVIKTAVLVPENGFNCNYAVANNRNFSGGYLPIQSVDNNKANANLTYAYWELDASKLGDIEILNATLSARFSGETEEVLIGSSNYVSGADLMANANPNKDAKFENGPGVNFNVAGSVNITGDSDYQIPLNNTLKINNGKIFLVLGKESSTKTSYIWNNLKAGGNGNLTISYVEKVDPNISNATLKDIKIGGVSVEGFVPEMKNIYVSNSLQGEEITCETTGKKATAVINGNVITVTSEDGNATEVYTIHFVEIKTATIPVTTRVDKMWNRVTGDKIGPQSIDTTVNSAATEEWKNNNQIFDNVIVYFDFDVSGILNNNSVLQSMTFTTSYNYNTPTEITLYNSSYANADGCRDGYFPEFANSWQNAKPVKLTTVQVSQNGNLTTAIDPSLVNISGEEKIVIVARKLSDAPNSMVQTYMGDPTIEITYFDAI